MPFLFVAKNGLVRRDFDELRVASSVLIRTHNDPNSHPLMACIHWLICHLVSASLCDAKTIVFIYKQYLILK